MVNAASDRFDGSFVTFLMARDVDEVMQSLGRRIYESFPRTRKRRKALL
jgi:hypothetical protein